MGVLRALACVAFCGLAASCDDGTAERADAGTPGIDGMLRDVEIGDGARPDGPAAGGTVRVEGDYFDYFRGRVPVVGGSVCVIDPDTPLCATTDADGNWALDGVPAPANRELRYEADGYFTAYRFLRTASRNLMLYSFAFASDDLVGVLSGALEVELDPLLGVVVIEATESRVTSLSHQDLAGVTARLRSVATGGEIHPVGVYANDMEILVRGLDETTSAGWGAFVNVQPGEYLVTFTHATRTCVAHPEIAWPAEPGTNATVRIAVHSNATAHATALCPE